MGALGIRLLRGQTAFEAGLTLLPMALASGVATPLAGRIYDRVGPRPLLVVCYGLLAFNTWQLAHLGADTSMGWIRWLLVIRGIALGLTVQTTFTTALGVVSPPEVGRASSLINATRFVVQAVSVALLATLLTAFLVPGHGAPTGHGAALPAGGLCAPVVAALAAACEENLRGFDPAYRATFWASLAASRSAPCCPAGRAPGPDATACAAPLGPTVRSPPSASPDASERAVPKRIRARRRRRRRLRAARRPAAWRGARRRRHACR